MVSAPSALVLDEVFDMVEKKSAPNLVNQEKKDLNGILNSLQYLRAQQQLLNNQMQMISSGIIRLIYLLETVEAMDSQSARFLNTGNNIFFAVATKPEEGLIVELGAGYFAHVDKSYAVNYLTRRKQKLETNLDRARTLSEDLNAQIEELNTYVASISRAGARG